MSTSTSGLAMLGKIKRPGVIGVRDVRREGEDDRGGVSTFRLVDCGIKMNAITHRDFDTPTEIHILLDFR